VNRGFRNGNPVHASARTSGIGTKPAARHAGTRGRAKAELENATRGIKSQVAVQLDAATQESPKESLHESVMNQ
jgi:hypothetical protein